METKELILSTRELEQLSYSPDFSKKEAIAHGKKAALEILDRGEITPLAALSNIVRLKEFVNSLEGELRNNIVLTETQTENGIEFSVRSTGDRLDYEKDQVYAELKEKLKSREDLLKLAYKSKDSIYDSEGVELMRVPIKTIGKMALVTKF